MSMNDEKTESVKQDNDAVLCEDITKLLVHRSDMSELSEYFGRDARRYDNGFEIY